MARSSSFPQDRIPPSTISLSSTMVFPSSSISSTAFVATFPPILASSSFLFTGSPGSGKRVPNSAARQAASGRLAGQICNVEICPWRIFFSCTLARDACFRGNATSISRGLSFILFLNAPPMPASSQELWQVHSFRFCFLDDVANIQSEGLPSPKCQTDGILYSEEFGISSTVHHDIEPVL